MPPHLPRIDHRHEPDSCQCGECGQGVVKIGEDITEQLDVEPARFFVPRHIRPQYACPHCETVTRAEVPPALIDGGMAARQGVPLALSTLAEWVGRLEVALHPLADRLAELQRLRPVLHADETQARPLDPGRGKTHVVRRFGAGGTTRCRDLKPAGHRQTEWP